MAIEDIDNLTKPLSDLVGEQGEKAARRKKQLAEVRATRAAGMTADEAKAAAERGDFPGVEPAEDNETNQDINAQMEFQKFIEQNVGDKALGFRTLGTAKNIISAPSSGFGGEYDARNLPILKDMGPVTQALFNVIAPYGEKAFDIADTIFRLPGAAAADIAELTGSSESDVNKLQAEINTMIGLFIPQTRTPGMASAATNQVVNAVSKSAQELNNIRKFIPEILEGQYSIFASPKAQSVGAKAVTAEKTFLEKTKSNTRLNRALREIGEEKVSQTTTADLLKILEKDYGIKVGSTAISKKNITKPAYGAGSGNQFDQVRQAFESIDNPEQYSVKDLMNLPQMKKVLEENNIDTELFRKYKSQLGIKSPTTFFGKLGVSEKEVTDYITDNPTVSTPQLRVLFPRLKEVSTEILNDWRKDNKLTRVKKPETRGRKYVLEETNPELSKQLDFISQSGGVLPSNVPIKHKDAFSEIITINRDGKPLDVKRTKIYQAHGIGEGGVTGASDQIIKSKAAMIPDKFLNDVKLPKFFLTKSDNDLHRNIEDNLVLALVNKYDKLGYNFVDGAWKQTKKVNPKSVNKELKDLETEIDGYRDQLKKIDAYTLFYNPIKDRMVSYGQDIDEIPGLSNLLNKVSKGDKKLRDGGIVSIFEMTKPLNAQR